MSNSNYTRIGLKPPHFAIFALLAYLIYEPLFWTILYVAAGLGLVFATYVLCAMVYLKVRYPKDTKVTFTFPDGFKFTYETPPPTFKK